MKTLPFLRRPPIITPLALADCEALQSLHGVSFFHGWDAAAFRGFLLDQQIIGFGARLKGSRRLSGFILARLVRLDDGGEAEILTFAVAPKARRRGIGRALLEHLLRCLYQQRAEVLFLEADAQNTAALALYRSLRFKETGRRKAYYQTAPAPGANGEAARSDAILLEYRFENRHKS